MQYLSPRMGNWQMIRQGSVQPAQASGPSTAQSVVLQTYAAPQEQPTGGQTPAELLKLQQQQQAQATPLGQNYLRQFMPPISANYFQQLY